MSAANSYERLDTSALSNVPPELREGLRFVCWREVVREGKPTKIPVCPHNGAEAESDNPETWGTLGAAVGHYNKNPETLQGIGRMFDSADGIMGVDFDKCLDGQGNIIPGMTAAEWLPKLNSYSEVSPSRKGVKVWLRATHDLDAKTGRNNRKLHVEIYRERRYFTITGNRLPQFSGEVESRQEVVDAFVAAVFPAKKATAAKPMPRAPSTTSDDEIIERASNARNGDKFRQLWAGNWKAHYGSQSEADCGLCGLLWFWTGGDREAVARLFTQSGLMREKWNRDNYQQATLDKVCNGEVYQPGRIASADAMQTAVNDPRPKIRLPGDNWLMSSTASELGQALGVQDIFRRNGEVCILRDSELHPVDPQAFRTWIENHCIMYRQKTFNERVYEVNVTLRDDESRGILASPQFTGALRVVRRVNHARLPILRRAGEIELLPVGYDAPSQTLTLPGVEYPDDMPHTEAVEIVNDLLGEVAFTKERSKAVAVAGMVSLFVNQVLPEKSLRPCFVFHANAEGAGKTLLVMCLVTPTLGAPPIGCKADEDAEVRKLLLTAVREARPVLFIDNVKGRLSCEPLEAFLSAPVWSDRILGVSESFTADNLTTVFVTGNGMTVSPDMRRRSLFVELHLEAERAEDRQFKRPLDVPTLLTMRPKILAALWALVRHWDAQGRPAPSRSHSAFPSWAKIVGGIVEAYGFGCALETPEDNAAVVADVDGDDMRRLVAALEAERRYTFAEIVEVCQANGCFEGLVGATGDDLRHSCRIALSRLLLRYERRLVGERRFQIEGKGHARRYHVERATDDAHCTLKQTVPADTGESLRAGDGPKEFAEFASVQPEPPACDLLDDTDLAAHRAYATKVTP
jgi:hypothetical protein